MAVYIVKELCKGCAMCVQACPRGAISAGLKEAEIDPVRCDECEECVFACPNGAITGGQPVSTRPTNEQE
ncbi:MAG: 4Fe-4S binding protein [Firmicutes bacterium]|nr:4Fe-4S binding protein [Bacillota bacterium]